MSCLQSPARSTKDLTVVAILCCYPFGAKDVPPAPRLCGHPRPPNLLASLCLRKLHVQNRGEGETPEPHRARFAARLGLGTQPRGAGSRALQAAGPGLIDSDPADKVLRALVVELGLNRADELLELWISHHKLDSPSDLPATEPGVRLGWEAPTSPHR